MYIFFKPFDLFLRFLIWVVHPQYDFESVHIFLKFFTFIYSFNLFVYTVVDYLASDLLILCLKKFEFYGPHNKKPSVTVKILFSIKMGTN